MKQMDECLDRYFAGKPPLLSKKWKATTVEQHPGILLLFHYQHLILAYRLEDNTILYQWHEVPADKRGLDAALEYLTNR